MMYSFYATVHAQPAAATPKATLEMAGQVFKTLAVSPESLSTTVMDLSFEQALERLGKLERMFCEPDGSFVWVSSQADEPWQVDGNLYDRNDRLLFVDLKGTCASDQFDRLLTALSWPDTRLMFQLTRQAVFLEEAEFRRHASTVGPLS